MSFGEHVIEARAFLQFVLVQGLLLHELICHFAALGPQRFDLICQARRPANGQSCLPFGRSHAGNMDVKPRRVIQAISEFPFGVCLTKRSWIETRFRFGPAQLQSSSIAPFGAVSPGLFAP